MNSQQALQKLIIEYDQIEQQLDAEIDALEAELLAGRIDKDFYISRQNQLVSDANIQKTSLEDQARQIFQEARR